MIDKSSFPPFKDDSLLSAEYLAAGRGERDEVGRCGLEHTAGAQERAQPRLVVRLKASLVSPLPFQVVTRGVNMGLIRPQWPFFSYDAKNLAAIRFLAGRSRAKPGQTGRQFLI